MVKKLRESNQDSAEKLKLEWLDDCFKKKQPENLDIDMMKDFIKLVPISTEAQMIKLIAKLENTDNIYAGLNKYINKLSDPKLKLNLKYLKFLDKCFDYDSEAPDSLMNVLESLCTKFDSVLNVHAEHLRPNIPLYNNRIFSDSTQNSADYQIFSKVVKRAYIFKLNCIELFLRFIDFGYIYRKDPYFIKLIDRLQIFQMIGLLLSNFNSLYTEEKLTIKIYYKIFGVLPIIRRTHQDITPYAEFIIQYLNFYSEPSRKIFRNWLKFISRYDINRFPRLMEVRHDLFKLSFEDENLIYQLQPFMGQIDYTEIWIDILLHDASYFKWKKDLISDLKDYLKHIRKCGDRWRLNLMNSNLLALLDNNIYLEELNLISHKAALLLIRRYFYLPEASKDEVFMWLRNFNEHIRSRQSLLIPIESIKYIIRSPISDKQLVTSYLDKLIRKRSTSDIKELGNLIPILQKSDLKRLISYLEEKHKALKQGKVKKRISNIMKYAQRVYKYKYSISHISTEVKTLSAICSNFAQLLILMSEKLYNSSDNLALRQTVQAQSLSLYYKVLFISKILSIDCFPELSESDQGLIYEQPSFDIFSICDQQETRSIILNYIYSCGFRRLLAYIHQSLSDDQTESIGEILAWGRRIEYVVDHDYIKIFLNSKHEKPIRMFALNEFGSILINKPSVKDLHLRTLIDNFMMHSLQNAYSNGKIKRLFESNVMNEALNKLNLGNIMSEDICNRVYFCCLPKSEFSRSTIGGLIFLNMSLKTSDYNCAAVIKIFAACEYLNILKRSRLGNYRLEFELGTRNYLKGAVKEPDKEEIKIPYCTRQSMLFLFGSVYLNICKDDSDIINKINNWYESPLKFKLALSRDKDSHYDLISDILSDSNED